MIDLEKAILAELTVSRKIVLDGKEVVSRFVVFAPDGAHSVVVKLPHDGPGRTRQLMAARSFMIWKAAYAFVLANELKKTNAICAVAVTRSDVSGALQHVRPSRRTFREPAWFGRDEVGDEIMSLLPPRELSISADEINFIQRAFEQGGVPGIHWHKGKAMTQGQ